MSETPKKQTFLHGAALLTVSTAIVKLIGALYKIPLNAIIGEQGFGYFYTAYEIYSVLLLISTAGLPVAVSRMISASSALGHYNQVRRTYRTAWAMFTGLGVLSTGLMMVFCRQLADFQEQPNAWFAILCLGPSALFVCVISAYRGFFQGQGNMLPTSISQVLEAVTKLIVGIGAAVALLSFTQSYAYAAGGAILGVTVSCLVSMIYLWICFRKEYDRLPKSTEAVYSYGTTAKSLLAIAVPVTIGFTGLQILSVIETRVYMVQLLGSGVSQDSADTMKGIYNMCQTIFNMPCSFISPITVSIIPAITGLLTTGNEKAVKATEESAARITALIALPCAVGLFILAEPVTALLGGYTGENLVLAGQFMALLAVSIVFYATVQLTNAILQAHNHAVAPVVHMLICGVVRLVAVGVLVSNPNIGLTGVPIAGILCNGAIAVMNVVAIYRIMPQKPNFVRSFLRPVLPAAVMGLGVLAVYRGLDMVTDSRLLLCGIPVVVGVGLYCAMVVVCKVITREDCLLLPKGEKIAQLLHL